MADLILAIDELDNTLGTFFQFCKDDLHAFFLELEIEPRILDSAKLNDLSVQMTTALSDTFIFGAYSHGENDCLIKSNIPYISTTLNQLSFENCFFYTFSCSCGYELGSKLVLNGCKCFIGYNQTVAVWNTYLKPFVECANFGLKQFYKGEKTYTVVAKMTEKYNNEIDNLYINDFMIASILRENRDALILHGDDISLDNL